VDFVRKPEAFDVGRGQQPVRDILTDVSAIVTGSMGLAASATSTGAHVPEHVRAGPRLGAGQSRARGISNPLAAILSAGMLLEHLGLSAAAKAVNEAVAKVLKARSPRTPDLGGDARTGDVGAAVAAAV